MTVAATAPAISVFIADDHDAIRGALRELVNTQTDMRVIGDARDGETAVARVRQLAPNVAVLDVAMPEVDGIEAARQIRSVCPTTQVVMYSIHCSTEYVSRAKAAGASGYLPKAASGGEVVQAIRAVFDGGTYFSPLLLASG